MAKCSNIQYMVTASMHLSYGVGVMSVAQTLCYLTSPDLSLIASFSILCLRDSFAFLYAHKGAQIEPPALTNQLYQENPN